ncbi:hypothetical protein D9M71_227570 [compost metagenome]
MLIHQIGRQVHTDEHHLESADKKAERQQPESGMRAGFAQCFAKGLFVAQDGQRLVLEHAHQRYDQRHQQAQREQRRGPAKPSDQTKRAGQHRELAERAGSTGDPHAHAAFFRWYCAADHPQNHRERRPGQPDADQQAGAQGQGHCRVGEPHANQPGRVQDATDQHHFRRAEAVGQRAGEWLGEAPDQVLQGDGEGKDFTTPAELGTHRRQKQPEAMSNPQRQRKDQRTPQQNPTARTPHRCHCCSPVAGIYPLMIGKTGVTPVRPAASIRFRASRPPGDRSSAAVRLPRPARQP